MARLRPAMVAVIGTVLVLAGCGDAQPAGGPSDARPAHGDDLVRHCRGHAPASRAPTKQAPKPAPKPVPEQLRFTAETVDGKEFSGASLAGKPALLWFWAPWCPNCQAEAPAIAEGGEESPATCSSSASPRRTRCRRCRTSWTASTSARSRTSRTPTPPSGSGSA